MLNRCPFSESLHVECIGNTTQDSYIHDEMAKQFVSSSSLRVIKFDSNNILPGASNCEKLEELSCWYFSGKQRDWDCMNAIFAGCKKFKYLKVKCQQHI